MYDTWLRDGVFTAPDRLRENPGVGPIQRAPRIRCFTGYNESWAIAQVASTAQVVKLYEVLFLGWGPQNTPTAGVTASCTLDDAGVRASNSLDGGDTLTIGQPRQ